MKREIDYDQLKNKASGGIFSVLVLLIYVDYRTTK
jgi:hypothetical protein